MSVALLLLTLLLALLLTPLLFSLLLSTVLPPMPIDVDAKVATPLPLTAAEAHSTRFGSRWFSLARAFVLGLVPVLATPLKIVWSFYQVITQARDQPSECPLTL